MTTECEHATHSWRCLSHWLCYFQIATNIGLYVCHYNAWQSFHNFLLIVDSILSRMWNYHEQEQVHHKRNMWWFYQKNCQAKFQLMVETNYYFQVAVGCCANESMGSLLTPLGWEWVFSFQCACLHQTEHTHTQCNCHKMIDVVGIPYSIHHQVFKLLWGCISPTTCFCDPQFILFDLQDHLPLSKCFCVLSQVHQGKCDSSHPETML